MSVLKAVVALCDVWVFYCAVNAIEATHCLVRCWRRLDEIPTARVARGEE
jgi:hypothetical protein